MKTLILVGVLIGITGCATTARLYPVEGPYSEANPAPTIPTKFTGLRDRGEIEFNLPDGPACKGEWIAVSTTSIGVGVASSGRFAASGYGIGMQGQAPASAVIQCSDGRQIVLDFTVSMIGAKSGIGAGKDNRGNSYRFAL